MAKEYAHAESVESIANQLLPSLHPELATARLGYVFVDKASMKNGHPVRGVVRKVSGVMEFLVEKDFVIEVALDQWNELSDIQRRALVDHLLERCTGEEDEDNGSMKWKMREPDVHEFTSILRRHGAWNESLAGFVSVAAMTNTAALVEEVEMVTGPSSPL